MGDDALEVAHEAKNLAIRAMTQVEMLQPQLTAIGYSIEALRRENTEQHRENARLNGDAFKDVHARLSTVKTTIDANRIASQAEIKAVDEKINARITTHVGAWAKHRDKLLWAMAAIIAALIANRLGVEIPVFE